MSTLDASKQYAFISYSVNDILEGLEQTETENYLFLKRLEYEKLDCLLERAFNKGWCFWENDSAYWITHAPNGYEVYKTGLTHSTRCAQIGYTGTQGLQRAIAECERRASL